MSALKDDKGDRLRASSRGILRRPTIPDAVIFTLLAVLTFVVPGFSGRGDPGRYLQVRTEDGTSTVSLDRDGKYVLHGPLGEAILEVRAGEATLVNVPCPLKICEAMGPVKQTGQTILCLPNRISVRVAGEASVDAVSR